MSLVHFIILYKQNQDGSARPNQLAWRHTTDGLGAIFNQPRRSALDVFSTDQRNCQNQAAPRYLSSVCNMGRQQLSSSAFQVSLRLQTSNARQYLERRQPPIFRARIRYSVYKRILDLFLENDAAVFPVQLESYFAGLVFIIHYGAFFNLHFQKQRIGVFQFSIQTDSVFLYTLNKQSRCQTEFAIGRKLQSFQFRSINLRAAQMERAVARKAARNIH
ncbi:Hypothetical_protein [Hexamita inflata]|uniref:Hypothetical_protein n=1 Tax=Hexamita inflata TaxID=28002 RepID=A0AA86R168_9EUKA|nr:Hypothetical protein HINF_LOCUS51309 [Hexamita inflata]